LISENNLSRIQLAIQQDIKSKQDSFEINKPTTPFGSSQIITGHDGTPLSRACAKGNAALIRLLLQHPFIQPNKCVMYPTVGEDEEVAPLWLAVRSGNVESVEEMLKHGEVDVGIKSWDCGATMIDTYTTPLQLAESERGNEKMVDLLKEKMKK